MKSMVKLLSGATLATGLVALIQIGTTQPAAAQCSPGVCCWGPDGVERCTVSDSAKKGKHHLHHRQHKHVIHKKPKGD
jgi:hypothetical protein